MVSMIYHIISVTVTKKYNSQYDKKYNKLNIIKDKTEELYCLNCQITLQINVPIKNKHSNLS